MIISADDLVTPPCFFVKNMSTGELLWTDQFWFFFDNVEILYVLKVKKIKCHSTNASGGL